MLVCHSYLNNYGWQKARNIRQDQYTIYDSNQNTLYFRSIAITTTLALDLDGQTKIFESLYGLEDRVKVNALRDCQYLKFFKHPSNFKLVHVTKHQIIR